MPDHFGQIGIAGVAGHHLIESEYRQRRNHGLALPTLIGAQPVEPFDQQHVLARDMRQAHRRNIEPDLGSKPHGDELCLDDVVGVR